MSAWFQKAYVVWKWRYKLSRKNIGHGWSKKKGKETVRSQNRRAEKNLKANDDLGANKKGKVIDLKERKRKAWEIKKREIIKGGKKMITVNKMRIKKLDYKPIEIDFKSILKCSLWLNEIKSI